MGLPHFLLIAETRARPGIEKELGGFSGPQRVTGMLQDVSKTGTDGWMDGCARGWVNGRLDRWMVEEVSVLLKMLM